MKFLLDTQIFIWWDSEPEKLPARLSALFEDPSLTFVLSIASVWEMQIKAQLGKLDLNCPPMKLSLISNAVIYYSYCQLSYDTY